MNSPNCSAREFAGATNRDKRPQWTAFIIVIAAVSFCVSCFSSRKPKFPKKIQEAAGFEAEKPYTVTMYVWEAKEVDRLWKKQRGLDTQQKCDLWKDQAERYHTRPGVKKFARQMSSFCCSASYHLRQKSLKEESNKKKAARDAADREWILARRQARSQAIAETMRQEIETGKCSQQSYSEYERGVLAVEELLNNISRRQTDFFVMLSHEIVMANEYGTPLDFQTVVGGTIHVFVGGYHRVELAVVNDEGYKLGAKSPYSGLVSTALGTWAGGVTVKADAWSRSTVTVSGSGCVVVMAIRQY